MSTNNRFVRDLLTTILFLIAFSLPAQWVNVTGNARLDQEGADAQIDKLAKKYLDADTYPFRKDDEVRVRVPITPTYVEAHGFGEE